METNTVKVRIEPAPRHLSMVRSFHLADLFTLANAACGMAGVLFAMLYVESGWARHFLWAAAMGPAAFVFDVLDGRIARARHTNSALRPRARFAGRRDLIRRRPGGPRVRRRHERRLGRAALIYFVCCGVSRLARYNVTAESLSGASGKVKYFEGTPIPTSVVLVGAARLGRVAGKARRLAIWRCVAARSLGAASAGAAVRAVGHADDQQDPADTEVLAGSCSVIPKVNQL